MTVLAPGGLQLSLQIGQRSQLCPRRRSPPSVCWGKARFPGIEQVGLKAQFLGDHLRGLAAGEPVLDRFAFERFIKFTTDFDRCLFHGLELSLFAQFPVRQFEATSLFKSDAALLAEAVS